MQTRILAQIVIKKNKSNQGISLLELMLTILIISIISMFAIPTYKDYLLKANRIEAKTALYDLANRLENHFELYKTYANATIGLGQITDVLTSKISINNHYALSIVSASKHAYTIQATLINHYFDKNCVYFTLSNTGIQGASDNNKEKCW